MQRHHLLAPAAVAVLAAPPLAGCGPSGPAAVTCDDYAGKELIDRGMLVGDLLQAHNVGLDLPAYDRASRAIDTFCGAEHVNVNGGDRAGRNNSQPIDNAIDWKSFTL